MTKRMTFRHYLLQYFPTMIWVIAVVFSLLALYFFSQWQQAKTLNVAYADQSLLTHELNNDNDLLAYSLGYLLAENDEPVRALEAFETSEATADPHIRALSKHALGNLYTTTVETGFENSHGSRHLIARILLAREAYKGALRLEPDLYAARYNLERLDRTSPQKRGMGSEMADGYTIGIDPFKQNGRALMKDNTRRGLP